MGLLPITLNGFLYQEEDIHERELLGQWIGNNNEYEYNAQDPLGMNGCCIDTKY